MIKINLLRSMKDTGAQAGGEKPQAEGGGGFFAKLFPPKETDDFDLEGEGESSNPLEIGVKLIIIVAIAGGLFYHESINIPKLEQERDLKNQKLSELTEYNNASASSVNEIKRLKQLKEQIEKQIASLDGLSKVRLKYIRALDLIQSNLPEKMWFLNLKSKENLIEASGVSFTETEISQFLEVMGRSIYFSDVSMISSEDVVGKEGDVKKYKKYVLNFMLEATK